MKTNSSIELFSSKENQRYDEYMSFDSENASYLENVAFSADNDIPQEFADDNFFSQNDMQPHSRRIDRPNIKRSVSTDHAAQKPATLVRASFDNAAAIVAKISVGLSVAVSASVVLFVLVGAYFLNLFPGFSSSIYKIKSLSATPQAVFCDFTVDAEAMTQYEILVILYSNDVGYCDSRILRSGENSIEFQGLIPDTDYIFEIRICNHDTNEEFTAERNIVRTPISAPDAVTEQYGTS